MASSLNEVKPVFLAIQKRPISSRTKKWLRDFSQAGLDPYLASHDNVRATGDGVTIMSGKRWVAWSNRALDVTDVKVRPDLLYNRNFRPIKKGQALFDAIVDHSPGIWSSWNPYFGYLSEKSNLERILTEYEAKSGIRVERPKTTVVSRKCSNRVGRLHDFFDRSGVALLKPSRGHHCENIEILGTDQIERVEQILLENPKEEFVLQELVEPSPLLDGHRFDLRLYAMIWNFQVPKFSLYNEGFARMAGRPYDPRSPLEPESIFTPSVYQMRRGLPADNTTVSAVLRELDRQGLDVSDFWDRAQTLCSHLFKAIHSFAMRRGIMLERNFFLTGFDVALRQQGKNIYPSLLEVNDLPGFSHCPVVNNIAQDLKNLSRTDGMVPAEATVKLVN